MGKKAKPKRTSGPTKTYAERLKAGRAPVFVWLGEEATAALDSLIESGLSKTEAVEAGLLALQADGLGARVPRREPEPKDEPRPRGDVAQADDSPAALAERVRAKGARREAVEVATGRVSKDGGRPRQSR